MRRGKSRRYANRRWSIPFAGFLLALMGGFSYAWGVFIIPMVERFGWSTAEAALPFTVFMMVFALAMVPAGRLQDIAGPRKVSAVGAILFFLAYGLAALVGHFPYSWWLVVTYGVIGGVACGLTYACVAPPARKWFPDKPGLAISFGVMGFGLAALAFAPLKAGYLIPTYGIEGTFLIISITTLVVCLFAAWLIRDPPEGWKPPGWEPGEEAEHTGIVIREAAPGDLVSSPVFYVMWLTFALMISGGLMAMKIIPPYGEVVVGLTPVEAAWAVAIFAGFNGFGRPLAGFLSDRFGVVWVMIATYIIQTATLLSFHVFAVTLPTLYVASAFLGWSFAVTLSLFPALTALCFGTKHLGINYGLVFTAFGVGALSPVVGSWMFDVTGSYAPIFISTGILAAIGLILCVVLKKKYALP